MEEVYKSICDHIIFSSKTGSIRPAISVFRSRLAGKKDLFRIWNKQLISFAGYEKEDGTVVGDKGSIEFTKFCQRLGWKGAGGRFDILPLILSGDDQVPRIFEIPENIIKMVKIEHPE